MTTLLVVSPHLDDAVLSCAGAIHAHARRGEQVIVATVFTQGHDHAQRRAEDLRAVASLGAVALHLGLLDAPERLRCASTHRSLVEEASLADADVAWVQGVVDAAILRVKPARVWAPLGVGGHIDHRVVHAALRGHAGGLPGAPELAFYEERPYAFLAGAVRRRLLDVGLAAPLLVGGSAVARDLARAPDPAIVREGLVTLPHLRRYLADDDGGVRARTWLASRLCAMTPESEHEHEHGHEAADVFARVTCHDAESAEAAARAICMYESQIPTLFGRPARVASALRAAALALAPATAPSPPHAERTFAAQARP